MPNSNRRDNSLSSELLELASLVQTRRQIEKAYEAANVAYNTAHNRRAWVRNGAPGTVPTEEQAAQYHSSAAFSLAMAKEHEADDYPSTETGKGDDYPAWNKQQASFFREVSAAQRAMGARTPELLRLLEECGAEVENAFASREMTYVARERARQAETSWKQTELTNASCPYPNAGALHMRCELMPR